MKTKINEIADYLVEALDNAGGMLDQPPGYPQRKISWYKRKAREILMEKLNELKEVI